MTNSLNALPKEDKKTAPNSGQEPVSQPQTITSGQTGAPATSAPDTGPGTNQSEELNGAADFEISGQTAENPESQGTPGNKPFSSEELENLTEEVNTGISRLEAVTDGTEDEEDPQPEIRPMGFLVFLILMGAAMMVDSIDLLNNALNISGIWLVVATIFNILAQGAFAVLSWILCDKYLRAAMKAVKGKKGEVQKQITQTLELLKRVSQWIKPLGVILQIADSVPLIELIPMTMISVGLVYWYSKKIPRELLAAHASEMIEMGGEKMRKSIETGAETYERGSEIARGIETRLMKRANA